MSKNLAGLKSPISWRTFLVGVVVGLVVAKGLHWATTFYSFGIPVHELPW